MKLPVHIISLLVFIIGLILLQIFLSKKESRWTGLVLPIITFTFSLLFILNIPAGESNILIITTLLFTNIPTIILLTIYFSYKKNKKKISGIDKMNIQDLE